MARSNEQGDADAEWLVYEHDEPDDPAQSIETGAAFIADLEDRAPRARREDY